MKLAWVAAAAVSGVWLGMRVSWPWPLLAMAVASALAAIALLWKRGGWPLVAALVLIALLLGLARAPSPHRPAPGSIDFYNGRTVEVTALVTDADHSGSGQRLALNVQSLRTNGANPAVSGLLLAWAPPLPRYSYGDLLCLRGVADFPGGGNDFDYRSYLAQQGIHSVMNRSQIVLQAHGQGYPPRAWLYGLRQRLADALARSLPEPQASLAQALLLGLRRSMPPELSDAFNRTGTTHILAVSGMNISIVAGLLLPVGAWLLGRRRGYYLLLPLAGTWTYALLAGMGPPVVRAAIMATVFLGGHYLGRPGSAVVALALAAAVMVGLDPSVLGQVSFQLSFLSMLGLALLAPPLQGILERAVRTLRADWVTWARPVTTSVAVSLAAMAFTYPVVAMYFHRLSLVGLPATLLLLPALPILLVTSALTAVAGALSGPLGQVVGWTAWPWLAYQTYVVKGFALLPGAALDLGRIPVVVVAGYFGILGLALGGWRWLPRFAQALQGAVPQAKWVRWGALLAMATMTGMIWAAGLSLPDGRLHVFFLDVGQGDAILVQAGRHRVLIDGGPSADVLERELGKHLPFWDRTLDVVVLSHPEADHLAGLVEVLQRHKVGAVLEGPLTSSSEMYRKWSQGLGASGIPRVQARPGLAMRLGKRVSVEALFPPEEPFLGTGADTNNNSVVLRVRAGAVSFLLPGDLESVGEGILLAQEVDVTATVLKVAHHGSDTSTTSRFLAAVAPRAAVISVGTDNKFYHPSKEVVQRLEQIVGDKLYQTPQWGTVEMITDGRQLWMKRSH